MKQFLNVISIIIAGVGFASADCNFKPERIFGKVEVLNVIRYTVPKKNKCFRNRGLQLGKIHFRYEPEGTSLSHEYTGYYDAMTQCFDNDGRLINCWQVPVGIELREVSFIERERHLGSRRDGRGLITQLFLVP